MTLTAHALAGAIAAQVFPKNPASAFTAGFISHFIIDAVPHWDYKLLSLKEDSANHLNNDMLPGKNFILDLLRTGLDASSGILLAYLIFSYYLGIYGWEVAIAGAAGGLLPDALQFVYFKMRLPLLAYLQRFHHWIQAGKSLHVSPALGLFYQFLTLTALFLLVSLLL